MTTTTAFDPVEVTVGGKLISLSIDRITLGLDSSIKRELESEYEQRKQKICAGNFDTSDAREFSKIARLIGELHDSQAKLREGFRRRASMAA